MYILHARSIVEANSYTYSDFQGQHCHGACTTIDAVNVGRRGLNVHGIDRRACSMAVLTLKIARTIENDLYYRSRM